MLFHYLLLPDSMPHLLVKFYLGVVSVTLPTMLFVPISVSAQPAAAPLTAEQQKQILNRTAEQRLGSLGAAAGYQAGAPTFAQAVGGIIRAVLALLGVVFMAYIIWAGYLWMIARGDEEKIKKSKAILRGSIIGLVIVLSAYIITATVIDRFGKATGFNQNASATQGAQATQGTLDPSCYNGCMASNGLGAQAQCVGQCTR